MPLRFTPRAIVEERLERAGIHIDGPEAWDIRVHDSRLYRRLWWGGVLAFGESYMDGWWDCDRLDELTTRLLRSNAHHSLAPDPTTLWHSVRSLLFNRQRRSRAFEVGQRHYDLGNDLYRGMLDRRMVYSCGYWRNARTLDEAQEAKLQLICDKLGIRQGMRVLDIGCGWGSFARYAAECRGARVTGITVSREQAAYAREVCADLPVEIRLQDYREVEGQFDRVVSVGMFEHVGRKNYHTYMRTVRHVLTDDGLSLLHTIGNNRSSLATNPWTDKYIFPNGMLPSGRQIMQATEGVLVLEDWHSFGPDYDRTLQAWEANFRKAWPELRERYGERLYRMWRFYLLTAAASFRSRQIQLWQIVLSKGGLAAGYRSVR